MLRADRAKTADLKDRADSLSKQFPLPDRLIDPKDEKAIGNFVRQCRIANLRGQCKASGQNLESTLARSEAEYSLEIPNMVAALQKDPELLLIMQRVDDKTREEFSSLTILEPRDNFNFISPLSTIAVGYAPSYPSRAVPSYLEFLREKRFVVALGNTEELTEEQMKYGVDLVGFRTFQTMRTKGYGAPHKADFPPYWSEAGIEHKISVEDASARHIECTIEGHRTNLLNVKVADQSVVRLSDREINWLYHAIEENLKNPTAHPIYVHCRSGRGRAAIIVAVIDYIAQEHPEKAREYFPGYPSKGNAIQKLIFIRELTKRPLVISCEQLVKIHDLTESLKRRNKQAPSPTTASLSVAPSGETKTTPSPVTSVLTPTSGSLTSPSTSSRYSEVKVSQYPTIPTPPEVPTPAPPSSSMASSRDGVVSALPAPLILDNIPGSDLARFKNAPEFSDWDTMYSSTHPLKIDHGDSFITRKYKQLFQKTSYNVWLFIMGQELLKEKKEHQNISDRDLLNFLDKATELNTAIFHLETAEKSGKPPTVEQYRTVSKAAAALQKTADSIPGAPSTWKRTVGRICFFICLFALIATAALATIVTHGAAAIPAKYIIGTFITAGVAALGSVGFTAANDRQKRSSYSACLFKETSVIQNVMQDQISLSELKK